MYRYYLVFIIFLFAGCGGGSSSSSSSTASLNSGVFLDSKVQGLSYNTSTRSGVTDTSGTFSYMTGETVNFYIGNVYIGSSSGKSVLTPIDLVSGGDINNAKVLNIARVLQTFDSDKDPSNGITLVDAAKNLKSSLSIDFSNDANITSLINEVNATDGNLVEINATQALAHLQETFSSYTSGSDTYISNQYYLTNLNLTQIHKDYNGSSANGSIIQIVDTGIESTHEDLFANIDLARSYNAETNTSSNCTPDSGESHGTECAGIAGARGFNDKGVRGVNPLGKVVGFKMNTPDANHLDYTSADLEEAWIGKITDGSNIAVSSNSWGTCTSDSTMEEDMLKIGTEGGSIGGTSYAARRDGKGRVYVFAAGNERGDTNSLCINGSSNLSTITNNQYAIAVAAVKPDNKYAYFSSPGSNILISAYGWNIYTTTLNNTYSYFAGTSAATPMVAGAIGLILEACPNLTYRDVKYILAKTATNKDDGIDTSNSTWVQNSAGLWHSIDYGYGIVNVTDAINMCKNNYTNLGAKVTIEETNSTSVVVPNNDTNVTIDINITDNKKVEWVGVYSNINFDNAGDFEYYLTSPAGTTTKLLHGNNALETDSRNGEYRLSSVAFIDENSSGVWQVKIADINTTTNQINRTVNSIKLQIVGH